MYIRKFVFILSEPRLVVSTEEELSVNGDSGIQIPRVLLGPLNRRPMSGETCFGQPWL